MSVRVYACIKIGACAYAAISSTDSSCHSITLKLHAKGTLSSMMVHCFKRCVTKIILSLSAKGTNAY
jgi:hypothetical protein